MNPPVDGGGFILLWRKLLDSPVFTCCGPKVFKVFIYLLLRVNYRDGEWFDGRGFVPVPRGSCVTSLQKISTACGLTIRCTRTALSMLSRLQILTHVATHAWSMVSILNYESYQFPIEPSDTVGDKETTSPRQSSDKAATTNKEYKESKEVKEESPLPPASGGGFALSASPDAPKTKRRPKSELDGFVAPYAQKLHDRHPGPNNAGPSEIRVLLCRILAGVPPPKHAETLETIDRNHASMCDSPKWREDGGQYATGLANWLAPTMRRWESGWTGNLVEFTHRGPRDPFQEAIEAAKRKERHGA